MRLIKKVLLILSCVLLLNLLLGYYIQRNALLPSFSRLEHEDALQNMQRCTDALHREFHHLNLFVNDWSAWDDTYVFVNDRNKNYVEANLGASTLDLAKLNLLSIYNRDGELIWGMLYDFLNKEFVSMPGFFESTIPGFQKLINHNDLNSFIRVILNTARGPLMLISRPIVTSKNEGPIRGSVLMGRFLDDNMRRTIAEQAGVDVKWWSIEGNSLPPEEQGMLTNITPNEPIYINLSDKHNLNVYTTFSGMDDRPELLLKATVPRRIAARGTEAITYILVLTLAGGIITLIVSLLLLRKFVLTPIGGLTQHVAEFSNRSKYFNSISAMDLELHGDEIEMLAQAFEKLEAGVQQRTAQLLMTNEQLKQEVTERQQVVKALRDSEQQLHFLSSQLLKAQENERMRLSIELHDELGQSLMVLKLKLRSLWESLQTDQGIVDAQCDAVMSYINQITENVRRLSRDLRPSILEDLGFAAAIRWLIDGFNKHSNIVCTLDMGEIENIFSHEAQVAIYRILQECLTNIAKHAQATRVLLVVREQQGCVLFRVEDNGKGFNIQEAWGREFRKRGLGLAAMHERIRMLGGSIDMWSEAGAGTRITFTVPIDKGEY